MQDEVHYDLPQTAHADRQPDELWWFGDLDAEADQSLKWEAHNF